MRSVTAGVISPKTQPPPMAMTGRGPSAHDRRAVTLIELMIVLLIIGIFAAVAAPTFYDSLIYHRVESAARRVKADIERLQQTARLTSSPQSIAFHDWTAYTLSEDVADPDHPGQTYTVDLAAPPHQLDNVAIDFGGDTSLSFDGYGTPSRGGSIVLAAGNYTCTVLLDGSTGKVTKSDTTQINGGAATAGN